jgi:hypothetical protein
MLRKERIRLLIDRSPKLFFGEWLRGEAFREQGVEFFWRSCETWDGALFNGRQSGLDNFLKRVIGTAAEHRLNAAFLLRREMDRHGLLLGLMNLRVGEKWHCGKWNARPVPQRGSEEEI